MYEAQTYEAILTRMKAGVKGGIDTSEGSFTHDALAPAALELAQAYVELDNVLLLAFAQTSAGDYLRKRTEEHGIPRKGASHASGYLRINAVPNTVLPLGRISISEGGVEFKFTEMITVDESGTTDIDIIAVEPGPGGNVPAGKINMLGADIDGVISVTNPEPATGGVNEESDEALLERFLPAVQRPATSGNEYHYEIWASEVVGVGGQKVFKKWNGPGTVKVIIITTDKLPADQALIDDTYAHIDAEMPIGPTLTVDSAVELEVDIAGTVVLAPGYDLPTVKESFTSLVAKYFRDIALKQNFISHGKIGNILFDTPGIRDYSNLTINGVATDFPVGEVHDNCEVPVIGAVTLSV